MSLFQFFSKDKTAKPILRHPVLSLVLGLLISAYLFIALLLPRYLQLNPGLNSQQVTFTYVLIFFCFFNIFLLIKIIQWKKWAFYLYLIESLLIYILNTTLTGHFFKNLIYLLAVVILYGALQLGKKNKGWNNLK